MAELEVLAVRMAQVAVAAEQATQRAALSAALAVLAHRVL